MTDKKIQEQKTGYKYYLKFSQSLTTGCIGLEGGYSFDDTAEFKHYLLADMMRAQEQAFRDAGYIVAGDIGKEKIEKEREAREKAAAMGGKK